MVNNYLVGYIKLFINQNSYNYLQVGNKNEEIISCVICRPLFI